MNPTTYGRGRLAFYDELSGRAFGRLVEVLADMAGGSGRRAQTLMAEAIRRKCARLQSVFPERSLLEPSEGFSCPTGAEQIRLITACWIDSVRALADDNELDVPWPDGNGRVRPAAEVVAETILDDAVLVGRLIEIRRL